MTAYNYKNLYSAICSELLPKDDPIVCRIYNMLTNEDVNDDHNCLGCNLAERTWAFSRCIQSYAIAFDELDGIDNFDVMGSFFGWLNIIVEGVCDILDILGISRDKHSEYFPSFRVVKRWANFFKHPKAMMLTHHPVYLFERDRIPTEHIIVDTKFVEKFYGGDKRNNELYKTLQNQTNVSVLFPEPIELIKKFRIDIDGFLDLLSSKPFIEKLRDISTYENYWSSPDFVEQ